MGEIAVVTSLFPLDFEPQEMGRARNARIVIAHRLLAAPGQSFLRQIEAVGRELPEIGLNALLILRGRRDDLSVGDQPLIINPVAVIEETARRFGATVTDARSRNDLDRSLIRRFVLINDPQSLIACI